MNEFKSFCFGKDISPKWFIDKVNSKDVEYVRIGGKIMGCRFYDINNRERIFTFGEIITSDMLYRL